MHQLTKTLKMLRTVEFFCSYNEIIMRFEVEDKRAYSLIYIMYAFGCLYVHGDTRICTKNQGEIECLLRLPGQMCLLR